MQYSTAVVRLDPQGNALPHKQEQATEASAVKKAKKPVTKQEQQGRSWET
jgi:hypothetical protein